MATTERPENNAQEKFSTRLVKFIARILAVAALGLALVLYGSTFTGVLQWILVGAGVLLFIGLALYSNSLSGEVQRKLGPLPLMKPDRDLDSLPVDTRVARTALRPVGAVGRWAHGRRAVLIWPSPIGCQPAAVTQRLSTSGRRPAGGIPPGRPAVTPMFDVTDRAREVRS